MIDAGKPYTLFDPVYTWKKKTVTDFEVKELLEPIFVAGKCVYKDRDIEEIKKFCADQVETMWDEVLRFENPHNYYVDLSQKLWDKKTQLIEENRG